MIKTFKDRETEKVWRGELSRRLPVEIQQVALRKFFMLDKATLLDDLRAPPGNRLEALKGKRKGQWSIRINDPGNRSRHCPTSCIHALEWRICFVWGKAGLDKVEITDYH